MSSATIPEQIVAGRLLDISEYVDDVADAYDETAWSAVTFGDAIYGLPQDAGPSGMMYRSDIFAEYGIEVPTTFEEYLDAGRALKAANPDVYLAQLSPNEAGFWQQQVWQAGGSYYGIDGESWTVDVNNEASQEVAALWQTALDEELFKVVEMWTPEYWSEVNAGNIATINYLAWFPTLLEENAGNLSGLWSVTASPRIGGEVTSGSGGYGANVVAANSDAPEQAVEFAKWLNTSEEGLDFLIAEGGIFPAALDGLEHPALLAEEEYFGGQIINEVFLEEATLAPATWVAGPTHNLTQDALKDQFARVANGQITFAEALEAVAASERQSLEDAGLSVK
jgi:multiple sugar transport system substrate-binding protein